MVVENKNSLADKVFERLETDILSGKYAIGALITETGISKALEVSRTPVREAIRRLEQENLVYETQKGHVVSGVSYLDICDIFDVRLKIEGEATRRFAEIASDAQIKKMREQLELQEFYTSRADVEKIKGVDSEFHEIIYSGCGSKIYGEILSSLHKKVQSVRELSVADPERARLAVAEHRDIYSAVLAHDGNLAEALAIRHVNNAKISVMRRTAVKN